MSLKDTFIIREAEKPAVKQADNPSGPQDKVAMAEASGQSDELRKSVDDALAKLQELSTAVGLIETLLEEKEEELKDKDLDVVFDLKDEVHKAWDMTNKLESALLGVDEHLTELEKPKEVDPDAGLEDPEMVKRFGRGPINKGKLFK